VLRWQVVRPRSAVPAETLAALDAARSSDCQPECAFGLWNWKIFSVTGGIPWVTVYVWIGRALEAVVASWMYCSSSRILVGIQFD